MTKQELTKLIKLPYTTEPTLAIGLNGITQLKAISLKSRFTGSKKFIVDRDGVIQQKIKRPIDIKRQKPNSGKRTYRINKTKIRNIILNWTNAMKGYKQLYFITISFPPSITDSTAYKALNSWLTSMRQTTGLKKYIWIAERQKIGTIHFHVAIPMRVSIRWCNDVMKKYLHQSIRKKELEWTHTQAAIYNGVDIAKDRKTKVVTNYASFHRTKNLMGYLSKYISKSNEKFTHQAWQCSKILSGFFTHVCLTVDEFEKYFLDYIDLNECLIVSDFFNFFRWANSPPKEIRQLLCVANNHPKHTAFYPASQQKK